MVLRAGAVSGAGAVMPGRQILFSPGTLSMSLACAEVTLYLLLLLYTDSHYRSVYDRGILKVAWSTLIITAPCICLSAYPKSPAGIWNCGEPDWSFRTVHLSRNRLGKATRTLEPVP